jgi:hypothetical protein
VASQPTDPPLDRDKFRKTFDELEFYRPRLTKVLEDLNSIQAKLNKKRDELFLGMFGGNPNVSHEAVANQVEGVTKMTAKILEGKQACENFREQYLANINYMMSKRDKTVSPEDFAAEMYHHGFKIGYETRRFVELEDWVKNISKEYL